MHNLSHRSLIYLILCSSLWFLVSSAMGQSDLSKADFYKLLDLIKPTADAEEFNKQLSLDLPALFAAAEQPQNDTHLWQTRYLIGTHYRNNSQCPKVYSLAPTNPRLDSAANRWQLFHLLNVAKCFQKENQLKQASELIGQVGDALEKKKVYEVAAHAYLLQGDYYKQLVQYDSMLEAYTKSLEAAKQLPTTLALARSSMNLGTGYAMMRKADKAMTWVVKARTLNKVLNDKKIESQANNTVGIIHIGQRRFDEARAVLLAAKATNESIKNFEGLISNHTNLGIVAAVKGEFDKSYEHYKTALTYARNIQLKDRIAVTLTNLVWLELKRVENLDEEAKKRGFGDRLTEAESYAKEAIPIYESQENVYHIGRMRIAQAKIAFFKKAYRESIKYAQKAHDMLKDFKERNILDVVYLAKHNAYEALGEYKPALENFKRSMSIREANNRERQSKQFNEIREKYLASEKNIEIEKLKNEKSLKDLKIEKHRVIEKSLLVGVLFFAVAFGIIFKFWRDSQHKNRLIQQKSEELQQSQQQLKIIAMTDELTSLYNRRAIIGELGQTYQDSIKYDEPLCIALIDVDHFKNINDTWGHDGGDFILRSLADIFRDSIRSNDLVARWGGEEFILVMPKTSIGKALSIADKIRQIIEKTTFEFLDSSGITHPIQVTITLGCCDNRKNSTNYDRIISLADQALYKGKTSGRNKVVSYEDLDFNHCEDNTDSPSLIP